MSIDELAVTAILVLGACAVSFPLWYRTTSAQAPHAISIHSGWMDQPQPAHRFQPRNQSPAAVDQPSDGLPLSQLVWIRSDSASPAGPPAEYPLLASLDLARGKGCVPFATSPDADKLEQEARILTDLYWSERVWLTGLVDHERLAVVCTELERQHARHAATPVAKHIPSFFAT